MDIEWRKEKDYIIGIYSGVIIFRINKVYSSTKFSLLGHLNDSSYIGDFNSIDDAKAKANKILESFLTQYVKKG